MIDKNLAQWEIPGVSTIYEETANYPVVSVTNKFASADIALHGAHVMRYQPKGEEPVIWLSNSANYTEGKAIRGGVPICWPWFGDTPSSVSKGLTGCSLPAHGFARTRFWTLKSIRHDDNAGTELVFSLSETEDTLRQWPHKFLLELKVLVSSSLTLELLARNTDSSYFTFTGALHSYLNLGNISKCTIQGLSGVPYIDKLSNDQKTQAGDFVVASELDNIYQPSSAKVVIVDKSLNRELHIDKKGSNSTVVWNPWIEKSSGMKDLEEGGYRRMICVEAANTEGDIIVLQPQDSHCLSTTISIH